MGQTEAVESYAHHRGSRVMPSVVLIRSLHFSYGLVYSVCKVHLHNGFGSSHD